MVIPKYIEELIGERQHLAEKLAALDGELYAWLLRNRIHAPEGFPDGNFDPVEAANAVRNAIKLKGD